MTPNYVTKSWFKKKAIEKIFILKNHYFSAESGHPGSRPIPWSKPSTWPLLQRSKRRPSTTQVYDRTLGSFYTIDLIVFL